MTKKLTRNAIKWAATIALCVAPLGTAWAEAPLQYEVLHGSPFNNVSSTIIYGEKDAIVIDGGLFLSDGHRLAARLLDLKRNLTYAYITHADADHYLGLSAFGSDFPNAKIVALPNVAKRVRDGERATLAIWQKMMGGPQNLPTRVVKPQAIGTDAGVTLMLEGRKIEITGNQQGDRDHSSFVWIPSLRMVVTGDIVYSGSYPWTLGSTTASRNAWLVTLERVKALQPAVVVAGHADPKLQLSPDALTFTADYLKAYEVELGKANSADDMVARMKALYPTQVTDLALRLAADEAFAAKRKVRRGAP